MSEAQMWDLKAGDTLFRESDPWDGLYLVKAGHIEVFRERSNQTIRLAVLGPNEFLGTATIFTREPRTAAARALTDVTDQFFDSEFIHQNFGSTQPAVTALVKDIIARLKNVNQQLTEIQVASGKSVPD